MVARRSAKRQGRKPARPQPAARVDPNAGPPGDTIGDWLRFLGAELDNPDWFPVWPPDAFAFAAALLRRTGAYVGLVNGAYTRALQCKTPEDHPAAVGKAWRAQLEIALKEGKSTGGLRSSCPPQIKRWWSELRRARGFRLGVCATDDKLAAALISLVIAGDEASAQIGKGVQSSSAFLAVADTILINNQSRSLCLRVPIEKLGVLGKQHTPQRGCSIRSLSLHLSLYTPTEIQAIWQSPMPEAAVALDVFNLLLLPWPTTVQAGDFHASLRRVETVDRPHGTQRYFDYAPASGIERTPKKLAARVEHALDLATAKTDRIHGIVFPEVALTLEEFEAVEAVAIKRGVILISGVRGQPSKETNDMPFNACVIQPLGLSELGKVARSPDRLWRLARRVQMKHHRWCLDRNQILQYELGSRLPASLDCWERVFLGDRSITFITFKEWLTTCVLICEDLARQEPVTEVIRSVGPNLVFALLMDGPQLRNRWPARYASVLAEDPGCSVLSLTSLGMSTRSRPGRDATADKSRTIALWRDAVYGEKEIELPEGTDACVLSLVSRTQHEFTIDGRPEAKPSFFPVFAGVVPFSSSEGTSPARRYTRRGAK